MTSREARTSTSAAIGLTSRSMSEASPLGAAQPPTHTFGESLSADEFKAVFRGHPGGVAVITADAGHGPVALTATSVSSVSADPPLLIFSVSALSSAAKTLLEAETVVVHLLDAEDLPVAKTGATSGIDRFAELPWSRLVTGEPVYHGVRAWVRCAVIDRMDAGGSTIIAAHALQANIERDSSIPLVYHNRTWHRLGEDTTL